MSERLPRNGAGGADEAGLPVVVGAGLAGLVTALDLGVECLLVAGGELTVDCASDWAQGGLAAAIGPDDSVELHVADTLAAGAGLCEADAVRRIVGAAPGVVDYLVGLGTRFDREPDGSLATALEGAHSRNRVVHADGDGSGHEITRAVAEAVRAAPHVRIAEHTVATRLLTVGPAGRIGGVELLDLRSGHRRVVRTDRVVLATGGAGALYAHTTNPRGSWGSGLVLGLRAGAVARDLEMVQFHPTGLDVGIDPMPLVSEAVRGEGAHLVDDLGERVIADDLSPRDVVSRAVWARLGQDRRVFLDTPAALGPRFHEEFPTITDKCRDAGLDPATELLPVRPAAHYHMGGLVVDERGRTSVPGLWAVGEVSSTGLHGANRLASNSLLEAVVMGRAAAVDVREAAPPTADRARRADAPTDPDTGGTDPVRAAGPGDAPERTDTPAQAPSPQVRALMDRHCGVLRDAEGLTAALRELRPAAERDDAALLALLVCLSAYLRPASIGAHTRVDTPDPASLPEQAPAEPAAHILLTLTEALDCVDGLIDPERNR